MSYDNRKIDYGIYAFLPSDRRKKNKLWLIKFNGGDETKHKYQWSGIDLKTTKRYYKYLKLVDLTAFGIGELPEELEDKCLQMYAAEDTAIEACATFQRISDGLDESESESDDE